MFFNIYQKEFFLYIECYYIESPARKGPCDFADFDLYIRTYQPIFIV